MIGIFESHLVCNLSYRPIRVQKQMANLFNSSSLNFLMNGKAYMFFKCLIQITPRTTEVI